MVIDCGWIDCSIEVAENSTQQRERNEGRREKRRGRGNRWKGAAKRQMKTVKREMEYVEGNESERMMHIIRHCRCTHAFQFGRLQQTSYWTRGQNRLLPAQGTNRSFSAPSLLLSITQFSFSCRRIFTPNWSSTGLCSLFILPIFYFIPLFLHRSCFFFLHFFLLFPFGLPFSNTHSWGMKQGRCACMHMNRFSWGLSPLSCEAPPNTAVSGCRSSALPVGSTLPSYNHTETGTLILMQRTRLLYLHTRERAHKCIQ